MKSARGMGLLLLLSTRNQGVVQGSRQGVVQANVDYLESERTVCLPTLLRHCQSPFTCILAYIHAQRAINGEGLRKCGRPLNTLHVTA